MRQDLNQVCLVPQHLRFHLKYAIALPQFSER
jgi:hypothetical protein